jgi:ankyrin repeat protein
MHRFVNLFPPHPPPESTPSPQIAISASLVHALEADDVSYITSLVSQFSASLRLTVSANYLDPIFQHNPPLISLCAFYGAIRCFTQLLVYLPSVTQKDDFTRKPHHFAAAGNQVYVLQLIADQLQEQLSSDTDVDAELLSPDGEGKSILHFAAEYDSLSIFHFCFTRFQSAEIFDREAPRVGTPLHAACFHHSIKCFEFLANLNIEKIVTNSPDHPFRGLPINFNRELGPKNPLVLLMTSFSFDLIPIAQAAGLDVDAQLVNGWSVLFHAIRQRSEAFVRILCRVGAKVNWTCAAGWTPMHVAAQERLPQVCKILVKAGANPQVFTKFGFSPFLLARPLDEKDPERKTAVVVRELVIGFLARMLMITCVETNFGREEPRTQIGATVGWRLMAEGEGEEVVDEELPKTGKGEIQTADKQIKIQQNSMEPTSSEFGTLDEDEFS